MRNVNLKAAQALGLTIWQPRKLRCLVIRQNAHSFWQGLLPAEHKILTGMLSVLELGLDEYKQTTLHGNNATILITQMRGLITRWNAEYVLLLDSELPALELPNVVQTFSPNYLSRNPQYKAQAYKSLLTLRAMLHGTS